MYRILSRLLASLLIVAAALKLFGLAVDPVAKMGVFSTPWVQAAVILFEVGLGVWLWRRESVAAWLATCATFAIFTAFSLWAVWLGQASCNCFGPVPVSPWYALALDVGVLVALGLVRPHFVPKDSPRLEPVASSVRYAVGIATVLAFMVLAAYLWFGSLSAAMAFGRGEPVAVSPGLVDVGEGEGGEACSGEATVTNYTAETVRVVGGTDDCSCVVRGDLPVTLNPGESCRLKVQLYLPAKPGVFTRRAACVVDHRGLRLVPFRVTGRAVAVRPAE